MCYVCSTDIVFLFHPDLNGNETKYIDFEMPTRALMLLDELITLYSERSVCSFKEVQNAAAELGLPDNNGFIRCLLEIFSALGAVSWFPKVDHNLVVLKPQWLLDSLACLIREHEGHHSQLLNDLKQDKHAIPLFKEAAVHRGFFPADSSTQASISEGELEALMKKLEELSNSRNCTLQSSREKPA